MNKMPSSVQGTHPQQARTREEPKEESKEESLQAKYKTIPPVLEPT